MTVIGRQLAIQPKFREAKLVILCVGTKFDCGHLSPFCQDWEKLAERSCELKGWAANFDDLIECFWPVVLLRS